MYFQLSIMQLKKCFVIVKLSNGAIATAQLLIGQMNTGLLRQSKPLQRRVLRYTRTLQQHALSKLHLQNLFPSMTLATTCNIGNFKPVNNRIKQRNHKMTALRNNSALNTNGTTPLNHLLTPDKDYTPCRQGPVLQATYHTTPYLRHRISTFNRITDTHHIGIKSKYYSSTEMV